MLPVPLEQVDLDLPEIQSLDAHEVIKQKLLAAEERNEGNISLRTPRSIWHVSTINCPARLSNGLKKASRTKVSFISCKRWGTIGLKQ